ncbi:MAG: dipeptide epimerase [Candidatus Marinimicrobia bacterium]|nr:dipeptide epimerase [Candidatus Neomarinimicrobiota bacterium]MDD5582368.1 dipeptide epimerase [Candidatus Neomarinimicrobiota bacterium]
MEKSLYPTMKIDEINIYPFNIETEEIFKIATMSLSGAKNVLVEIKTNQGLTGWGEACSFRAIVGETQQINLAAAVELREALLGKNPLEVVARTEEMEAWLPYNTTIRSAFDMALYDIASQAAGLPLYVYLGGTRRPVETDLTIGIGTPEEASEKAKKILKKGFKMIKTKVGISIEDDLKRLRAIREAVGSEIKIRIDANQGWDRVTAVQCLTSYEELDIEFCEQPVRARDFEGLKYVSDHTKIPIMADESVFSPWDALKIIHTKAAPLINIKLSKSGGISAGLKIAHIAQAGYISCMTGCMSESGLANTAFTHFAMANSIVKYFDLDANEGHVNEPIVGGVVFDKGQVIVPDTPGIGAKPEPDFIKDLQKEKR